MAPPKVEEKKPESNELALLRAENERLKREVRASPTASKKELREEHLGARTYRVTQMHYRQGTLYMPGERITVTNEVPSKTWVLLDVAGEPKARVIEGEVITRPSDTQV